MGHAIVVAIHASGLRHDDFFNTISLGNVKNWFTPSGNPIVTVPKHELKCDAEMRWNSTHNMMEP